MYRLGGRYVTRVSLLTGNRSSYRNAVQAAATTLSSITCKRYSSTSPSSYTTDYFSLFNVERAATVDLGVLRSHYHMFQGTYHPDMQSAAAASSGGEENSNAQMSRENDVGIASAYAGSAYATLRDPYLRCRYLMLLLDADDAALADGKWPLQGTDYFRISRADDISEKERNPDGSAKRQEDSQKNSVAQNTDFLMEMMELNETLSDIAEQPAGARVSALQSFKEDILERDANYRTECIVLYGRVATVLKDTGRAARRLQDDLYILARDAFREKVLMWTYVNNLRQKAKELE